MFGDIISGSQSVGSAIILDMNLEKISAGNSAESSDPSYEALQKRVAFFTELDAVQTIEELSAVLQRYAYTNHEGELATPIFMQETEDYAQTVPHDGVWVVDVTVPLSETLVALTDYKHGHLSEQQLYNALGLEYNAVGVMRRITGVALDSEIQLQIMQGELPARGGDGETIDGDVTVLPKSIGTGM